MSSESHKAYNRVMMRLWQEKHKDDPVLKEKKRVWARAAYRRNREKILSQKKLYYQQHSEYIKVRQREYDRSNRTHAPASSSGEERGDG